MHALTSNARLFLGTWHLLVATKRTVQHACFLPPPRLGRMAGTRSMTEKTRFTAPEALVRSGKAICALAMPIAAKAIAKKTCMPCHHEEMQDLSLEGLRYAGRDPPVLLWTVIADPMDCSCRHGDQSLLISCYLLLSHCSLLSVL